MTETPTVRLNVMNVNSIEDFLNIRGSTGRGRVRNVYFVRALGASPEFWESLPQLDQKLESGRKQGRTACLRLSQLPRLTDLEAVSPYQKIYADWRAGGSLEMRTSLESARQLMDGALRDTLERYRRGKTSVSETMLKNFGVKLLFWADWVLTQLEQVWTEHSSLKVLADNAAKEQEYLFFYFLTQVGCDVLLLNTKADTAADSSLLSLSHTIQLGPFDPRPVPPYTPASVAPEPPEPPEPGQDVKASGAQEADVSQVVDIFGMATVEEGYIPPEPPQPKPQPQPKPKQPAPKPEGNGRTPENKVSQGKQPGRNEKQGEDRKPSVPSVPTLPPRPEPRPESRREKSFEELAELASSIVMVGVLDGSGTVVGSGSGIMIGRKGYILTNYHVVQKGRAFAVKIENDDNVYPTDEIIKLNPKMDVAVIRIQRELKPLPLYKGKEKLKRGQKVVAIGSPLGLFNSVSDGIISGFRCIDDVDMIQFTAPTSPGSSGGAVLNMYGEVIGISTAGFGNGQNINLAVGYEDLNWFVHGLV